MSDENKNASDKKNQIIGVIKYISSILGVLGIVIAVLTITNAVEWLLIEFEVPVKYGAPEKLTLSLASSILGIFFLFITFSKQIDKFFGFLETHEIKGEKKEGTSLESIFFFIIALILLALAIMLKIGYLILKTELPLLGGATKTVLIVALVILSILAVLTTFSSIIIQSLNEMKKVHWPSNKDMISYSKKVFSFIIFFSLFFFALDLIIAYTPKLVEDIFNIKL